MTKIESVADVYYEREMLEFAVDKFLRSRGWKYSCEHPGSFWLWSKKIRGKTYHVGKDLALHLQENLDLRLT